MIMVGIIVLLLLMLFIQFIWSLSILVLFWLNDGNVNLMVAYLLRLVIVWAVLRFTWETMLIDDHFYSAASLQCEAQDCV